MNSKLTLAVLMILSSVTRCIGSDQECGLKSLYVGMVALGHTETYDELARKCKPVPKRGYSLAELQEFAAREGFKTKLVRTSYDRLLARSDAERFACIAWLSKGHFVLISDIEPEKEKYEVVDVPHVRKYPKPLFEQQWSGSALLVSRQQMSDERMFARGPGSEISLWIGGSVALIFTLGFVGYGFYRNRATIRLLVLPVVLLCACASPCRGNDQHAKGPTIDFESGGKLSAEVSLGEYIIGSKALLRGSVLINNMTDTPIKLSKFRVSCGCVSLESVVRIVNPGERGKIVFRIDPAAQRNLKPRSQSEKVIVFDVEHASLESGINLGNIKVKWTESHPISPSPAEIIFEDVIGGQLLAKDITLQPRAINQAADLAERTDDIRVLGVGCSYGFLAAEFDANRVKVKGKTPDHFRLQRGAKLVIQTEVAGKRQPDLYVPIKISRKLDRFFASPHRVAILHAPKQGVYPIALKLFDRERREFSVQSVHLLNDKRVEITSLAYESEASPDINGCVEVSTEINPLEDPYAWLRIDLASDRDERASVFVRILNAYL